MNVKQDVYKCSSNTEKQNKLTEILNADGQEGTAIIVNNRKATESLASFLFATMDINAASIISSSSYELRVRKQAIEKFEIGDAKVLITTYAVGRWLSTCIIFIETQIPYIIYVIH